MKEVVKSVGFNAGTVYVESVDVATKTWHPIDKLFVIG